MGITYLTLNSGINSEVSTKPGHPKTSSYPISTTKTQAHPTQPLPPTYLLILLKKHFKIILVTNSTLSLKPTSTPKSMTHSSTSMQLKNK